MVNSEKILSAVLSNWWLNALGMLLSFCASVVLVRAVTPELYAQFAAVLAMIWVVMLVFEAGANSGLTRYLAEAAPIGARGSFYRAMQRHRLLIALVLGCAFAALGPFYARSTKFASLADQPFLFVLMALIVAASLARVLAHYGLLALFETHKAIVWEQFFLVSRSTLLAIIGLFGGSLWDLVVGLLAITVVESVSAHYRLWRIIGHESQPLPPGFINKAQAFGFLTIFDKACASLGSGPMLLLVLAAFHSAGQVAFLALAADLTGKLVSLTVMPMGNLVAPYLSHMSDDPVAQARAIARVLKYSSLLYCFTIGAGMLLLPEFIPLVYGTQYGSAVACTLVLLLPIAFENWVRGIASPALLRNGRYRELATVNIFQAVVTIVAIWLVHRQSLLTAVAAIVIARALVSVLNLVLLARIAAPGAYAVPAQGAAISVLAAASGFWTDLLPLPPLARLAVQGTVFTLIFYVGLRWVVLRDADTLQLAHRLTGRRTGAWLLPSLPC